MPSLKLGRGHGHGYLVILVRMVMLIELTYKTMFWTGCQQRFVFTCSELRNRIHDSVLPTGAGATRISAGQR